MDVATQQIRSLYDQADENGRRKVQNDLRELQSSLDSDWDVVFRLASGPLQVALAKIGVDLHLFKALNDSKAALTLAQLAEKSGATPALLVRILRTQAAFGMIKETGMDEFAANRCTTLLADPNAAGAIVQLFDIPGPVTQAFPDFLKEKNYQNITSNTDTPFQKAFNTNLTPFEWMYQHPEHMKSLGHLMAMQRGDSWVNSFPVEKEVGSFTAGAGKAILVDVGGGYGQQSIEFRSKFPNLQGRVVVQDIPATLNQAKPFEGVEFMVHDFFTPQTIKEAKFYYLRHVLHDWTDEDCIRILKEIIPAMGSESRIIIDEVVLPDVNVPWQAAYMDITMMSSLGGIERTKTEWEKLMSQAGLKILEIHKYDPKMQSIIVAVPK